MDVLAKDKKMLKVFWNSDISLSMLLACKKIYCRPIIFTVPFYYFFILCIQIFIFSKNKNSTCIIYENISVNIYLFKSKNLIIL